MWIITQEGFYYGDSLLEQIAPPCTAGRTDGSSCPLDRGGGDRRRPSHGGRRTYWRRDTTCGAVV